MSEIAYCDTQHGREAVHVVMALPAFTRRIPPQLCAFLLPDRCGIIPTALSRDNQYLDSCDHGACPMARPPTLSFDRGTLLLHPPPPGAGKTYRAQLVMQDTQQSTLIVVPTLDLMHQWYAHLVAVFPDAPVGL